MPGPYRAAYSMAIYFSQAALDSVAPQPSQSLSNRTAFFASSGSRRWATCIIRAHSIRLRNTLQPYSYVPWMSPVACRALAAQPPAQYRRA